MCGQGYPGEKGPRGFAGDDGNPVCLNLLMINLFTYLLTYTCLIFVSFIIIIDSHKILEHYILELNHALVLDRRICALYFQHIS